MVKYYRLDKHRPVELRGAIEYHGWLDSLPKEKRTALHYILASDVCGVVHIVTYFLGSPMWSASGNALFATYLGKSIIEYDCYDDAIVGHRELCR